MDDRVKFDGRSWLHCNSLPLKFVRAAADTSRAIERIGGLRYARRIVNEGERHGDAGELLRDRSDFEVWAGQVVRAVEERQPLERTEPSPVFRLSRRLRHTKGRILNAFLSH